MSFLTTILRIKVPLEVALAIMAIAAILLFLVFAKEKADAVRARLPPRVLKGLGYSLGGVATLVGVGLLSTFLMAEIANSRQHLGVRIVDEADAIAVAALLVIGAAFFRWAGARWLAVVPSALVGLSLILKPFVWPLSFYRRALYGGPGLRLHTFSTTSETHLYFLISGVVLLVMAVFCARRPSELSRTPGPVHPSWS